MVIDLDALTVDCPACMPGQKDCGLCDMTGHVPISRGIKLRRAMNEETWAAFLWLVDDAIGREVARFVFLHAYPVAAPEADRAETVTVQ